MLCKEIMEIIEKSYPGSCALDWDNVGLLAGRSDKEVRHIYVALDATDEVIADALQTGADMLVTHHPMVFSPMRRVTDQDFIGRRLIRLIQGDLAYYAMHTNYDVLGMAELTEKMLDGLNGEILDVTCPESPVDGTPQGIGRVIARKESCSLREFCEQVKKSFCLDYVKVFGSLEKRIERIAISPGAGKSMVHAALSSGADVLVTGDIDHHTGIDAVAQGLAIIDAGHYGTEYGFIHDIAEFLRQKVSGVEVTEAEISHPFQIL